MNKEEMLLLQKQRQKEYRDKIKDMDSLLNLINDETNDNKIEIDNLVTLYKNKYDWFEDVYNNVDLNEFKASKYNIRKINKLKSVDNITFNKEELKVAVMKLDEVFKDSMKKLRKYLKEHYIKSYPIKFKHNEIVEILTEACTELGIYQFNSGSYLTLLFDVKYTEGIYTVIGNYTGGGYKVSGRIGQGKIK